MSNKLLLDRRPNVTSAQLKAVETWFEANVQIVPTKYGMKKKINFFSKSELLIFILILSFFSKTEIFLQNFQNVVLIFFFV